MNRREVLKQLAMLLGSSLSPTIIAGVTSSNTHYSHPKKSKLSRHQHKLITLLSERIIPATDTPGAIEARVPEFDCFGMAK
jgi:hypothetical protein